MNTLIAIFIGGGLGSISRYGIGKLSNQLFQTSFPLGTLIANILSCIILALAYYTFKDKIAEQPFLTPLIIIGFCGGFSTFSTFSNETFQLFQNGHTTMALLNIGVSVFVCTGLIYLIAKAG